jgi:hypothetical protein
MKSAVTPLRRLIRIVTFRSDRYLITPTLAAFCDMSSFKLPNTFGRHRPARCLDRAIRGIPEAA